MTAFIDWLIAILSSTPATVSEHAVFWLCVIGIVIVGVLLLSIVTSILAVLIKLFRR